MRNFDCASDQNAIDQSIKDNHFQRQKLSTKKAEQGVPKQLSSQATLQLTNFQKVQVRHNWGNGSLQEEEAKQQRPNFISFNKQKIKEEKKCKDPAQIQSSKKYLPIQKARMLRLNEQQFLSRSVFKKQEDKSQGVLGTRNGGARHNSLQKQAEEEKKSSLIRQEAPKIDLQQFEKSKTVWLEQEPGNELLPNPSSQRQMGSSQKELVLSSSSLDLNFKPNSYVYLANGLLEDFSHQQDFAEQVQRNYNSAFFESDQAIEQYNKGLKGALVVQFQREENLANPEMKPEYDKWTSNLRSQFIKTSKHETLVRAQETLPPQGYDYKIRVIDPQSDDFFIHVKFRPYLKETLAFLQKHFELILFTASSEQYAEIVLETFQGQSYFDHVLSRKHCTFIAQYKVFVKDLSLLLNGRHLKDIIIVDNRVESYSCHLENGIPIKDYYGEPDDQMLLILQKYLYKLRHIDDVRDIIRKDFFLPDVGRNQIQDPLHQRELRLSDLQILREKVNCCPLDKYPKKEIHFLDQPQADQDDSVAAEEEVHSNRKQSSPQTSTGELRSFPLKGGVTVFGQRP